MVLGLGVSTFGWIGVKRSEIWTAEGTRLKQLESHMEMMECGMIQMQEAMMLSKEEIRAIQDELREDMVSSRDEVQRELER